MCNYSQNGKVSEKAFEKVIQKIDTLQQNLETLKKLIDTSLHNLEATKSVVVGNKKNKVGVGVAKGNDVTTAVAKATSKAKKTMVTFNMDGETICHETRTKVTGADVLLKPAAPGTGIIAGGTVRSIMGLTGVKNLISKSLGSTNKVNIAYAVIEGLKQQTPRSEWNGAKKAAPKATAKKETK